MTFESRRTEFSLSETPNKMNTNSQRNSDWNIDITFTENSLQMDPLPNSESPYKKQLQLEFKHHSGEPNDAVITFEAIQSQTRV